MYKKNRRKKLLIVCGVLVKLFNKDNIFLKDFIMVYNCIIKRLVLSYLIKNFIDSFIISNRIIWNLVYVYLSVDCLLISCFLFLEVLKILYVFLIIMGINCFIIWF